MGATTWLHAVLCIARSALERSETTATKKPANLKIYLQDWTPSGHHGKQHFNANPIYRVSTGGSAAPWGTDLADPNIVDSRHGNYQVRMAAFMLVKKNVMSAVRPVCADASSPHAHSASLLRAPASLCTVPCLLCLRSQVP